MTLHANERLTDAMAIAMDAIRIWNRATQGAKEMCPLVDTCPETCVNEFWATAGACIALTGWMCLIAAFYRPAPTPMEICEETLEWHQCETLERHVEDFDKLNYIKSVNGKYIYLMQTDLREYEVMIEPSEPFDVFLVRQGDEVVWSK